MRRPRPSSDLRGDDEGSAALEFIVAGVVLLVPIVYLIVTLGLVQAGALGVDAAARHVARSVAASEDAADADERSARVIASIIDEYDLDPESVEVSVSCAGPAEECPDAGRTLRVTVSARVPLPLVPPVLGLDETARVTVESTSVQKVSRYWDGS
ncbi:MULTISPECIES: TadE family protein [unclassified Microbacterium]|uniref:TadE family protein n=1 Tax=unclassified Microbacterium TaxID=2609290 RepID=UPI003868DA5A